MKKNDKFIIIIQYIVESLSILTRFPKDKTARQIQQDILNKIDAGLQQGYKKFVICAPTGSGKSFIAKTIANYFRSSFIVTASKQLQNQYSNGFIDIKPVKGKNNFACLRKMDIEKVTSRDDALKEGYTCDKELCYEYYYLAGQQHKKFCKYMPSITDYDPKQSDSDVCLHYKQKYDGLRAACSVWNYASFFQIMTTPDTYLEYLRRKVTIFDEAHRLISELEGFFGMTIRRHHIEECKLDLDSYDLRKSEMIVNLTVTLENHYAGIVDSLEKSEDYSKITKYANLLKSLRRLNGYICAGSEMFTYSVKGEGSDFEEIKIEPLMFPKLNEFFSTKYLFFMSATIWPDEIARLGIPAKDICFLDMPSTFADKNRPVHFVNVDRLNYRNQDSPIIFEKIDSVLSEHEGQKGLILTSSKNHCRSILNNCKNSNRMRMLHSQNDDNSLPEEIMQNHKDSTDGVLVSSSMWEGIDLPDDLSRFEIIVKAPFARLDEIVKEKDRVIPGWYRRQTLLKILQGMGRSVRSDDDYATTYVLDSNVQSLLEEHRDIVPKGFGYLYNKAV